MPKNTIGFDDAVETVFTLEPFRFTDTPMSSDFVTVHDPFYLRLVRRDELEVIESIKLRRESSLLPSMETDTGTEDVVGRRASMRGSIIGMNTNRLPPLRGSPHAAHPSSRAPQPARQTSNLSRVDLFRGV